MNNRYLIIIISFFILLFPGCNDWLDRDPKDILTENEAYSSIPLINSIVAGLYDRLPDMGAIHQGAGINTQLDDGMLGQNINNFISFPLDYWQLYDYSLLRSINFHRTKVENTLILDDEQRRYYIAEARFLRAYVYFEMVKRMGGVPLLLDPVVYESDDITTYQVPRTSEKEIYDFIATEMDEIKEDLDLPSTIQYNRASKGVALALKCRAMLYAGTLAKYNSLMPIPLTLPNGEVGIPAGESGRYFEEALSAAEELEALGTYSLYDQDVNKTVNYSNALIKSRSAGNNEIIFIKEYAPPANYHNWTFDNLPRTLREGGFSGTGGASVNPSLNLVDEYDRMDGSDGKIMPYTDPDHRDETVAENALDGNPEAYIHYNAIGDIFEGKDPRLFATILTPGSTFAGKSLDIRAGIAYYNETAEKYDFMSGNLDNLNNNAFVINRDTIYDENKRPVQKTGLDGPSVFNFTTRTGFYVMKSMDENPSGAGSASAIQSVRYRYSEVLLNAAEAAFELGDAGTARNYLKQVRDRAGVETPGQITLELIRKERRCELAYEGHRFYDLKRWRIAEETFDGNASNPSAMIYGLYPYKVYRPGHETHDKWIFVRRIPTNFTFPRKFVWANYYTSFNSADLTKNPKLVKNPGH